MTQGMKTSEFYVGLGATVIANVLHFYFDIDPQTSLGMISPLIGYILSRGLAKTQAVK